MKSIKNRKAIVEHVNNDNAIDVAAKNEVKVVVNCGKNDAQRKSDDLSIRSVLVRLILCQKYLLGFRWYDPLYDFYNPKL